MTGFIGVAISTHARPQVLARALSHWALAMPDILIVNHDINADGVAATKNRGITALMQAGCHHLFLADDDIWPITTDWADPYVNDPEPHLMHCWGNGRFISDDGHYTHWKWPRGALLYVERRVIDTIGGMRTEFGRWGGEHVEWTRRIHKTGFTKHPYTDLTATRRGTWHAEDYKRRIPSTVSPQERRALTPHRHELYARYRGSADYVDYTAGHS